MMSRTSVCAPKPSATPTMPAPVSAGEMSTPNSLQDHQGGDHAARRTVVMLVSTEPSVRARLARSSASRPVPKLTSCSKRLTPTATVADEREGDGRRPAGRAGRSRTSRCSASAGAGRCAGAAPPISKAGKIRTAKTSTNVREADQPQRGADQRARRGDGVAEQVPHRRGRRARAPGAPPARRPAASGARRAQTSCQSARIRETAAATWHRSIADGPSSPRTVRRHSDLILDSR